MNKYICTGRWTKEIELKYLNNDKGTAVAKSTLAINDRFNKDKTTFLPTLIYGKVAENTANYSDKGLKVAATGRIETRSYDGQDGKKVYVTEFIAEEVEFLEFKAKDENNNYSGGQQNQSTPNRNNFNDDPFKDNGTPIDISDDDLPF